MNIQCNFYPDLFIDYKAIRYTFFVPWLNSTFLFFILEYSILHLLVLDNSWICSRICYACYYCCCCFCIIYTKCSYRFIFFPQYSIDIHKSGMFKHWLLLICYIPHATQVQFKSTTFNVIEAASYWDWTISNVQCTRETSLSVCKISVYNVSTWLNHNDWNYTPVYQKALLLSINSIHITHDIDLHLRW